MKNLMASLMVAVALIPAVDVRKEQTARGVDQLLERTAKKIALASEMNEYHTWVNTKGLTFIQKYKYQREAEKAGYVVDIPLFGSTFIGW